MLWILFVLRTIQVIADLLERVSKSMSPSMLLFGIAKVVILLLFFIVNLMSKKVT